MSKISSQIFSVLLLLLMLIGITACGGSSEPCQNCKSTPTTAYKNDYTGEKEYYCKDCASDCAFCTNTATKHYTTSVGQIVFACDDCYKEIQALNQQAK